MRPDYVTYDVYFHYDVYLTLVTLSPMPLAVLRIKTLFLNHILILQDDFFQNHGCFILHFGFPLLRLGPPSYRFNFTFIFSVCFYGGIL